MTTKRQQKRAERAKQKALRKQTREHVQREKERRSIERARFLERQQPVRWMPIPGVPGAEVNNRGEERLT